MTVSIDVDLNARNAQVKLGLLEAQISELGDNLDLDLGDIDLDLDNLFDDLTDTIDELSESFASDFGEQIDRLEEMEFEFEGVPSGGGDSGGDTGSDSGDRTALQWAQKFANGYAGEETDARSFDTIGRAFREREKRLSSSEYSTIFEDLQMFGGDRVRPEKYSKFRDDISLLGNDGDELLSSLRTLAVSKDEEFGGTNLDKWMRDSKFMGGEGNLLKRSRYKGPELSVSENFGDFNLGRSRISKGFKTSLKSSFDGDFDLGRAGRMKKGVLGLSRGLDKVTDAAKGAIPRMSTWFNLIAAAIPALAAVVVQALGVAAAFGAVATAGLSMVGIGLLGHGDNMASSFQQAKYELRDLKLELFKTIEPAADLFAGVQSEFFDFIPGELDRVAKSMQSLLPLKGEFFEMFTQITKFISQFFTMIGSNSNTISELFESFKGFLGNGVIDLFEWLMMTAEKNQPMIKELGHVFKVVALALYEVFLVVSKAITKLTPLWLILAGMARLMNNEFVANFLAAIAVLYIFTNILPAIYLGLQAIGFALQRNMIPAVAAMTKFIAGWITKGIMAIGVNAGLAASIAAVTTAVLGLLAATGVGALLSIGGGALMGVLGPDMPDVGSSSSLSSSSGSMSGTTNNYYEGDTVNVNLSGGDTASFEKFKDMRSSGGEIGAPVNGSYTK